MTKLDDIAKARAMCRSGEARRIREVAGVSLAEVGAEVGTTAPTVQRWETGQRVPRGEAALRYGRLLRSLRRMVDG